MALGTIHKMTWQVFVICCASYHIDFNMVMTHMVGMKQPSVTQLEELRPITDLFKSAYISKNNLYKRVFSGDNASTLSTSVFSQKVDISKCPLFVHSMLIHRFLSIFAYLLFRRCWRRIKCQFLRIFVRTSSIEGKTLYTYMALITHFRKLTTHYITE